MPTAKPRRDPLATRKKILAAASALLVDSDGNLEMSWVASRAGVSQGLAYHHFGSKEGLLGAVVEDFYDRVEDSVLMARLEDYADWSERERERVARYLTFLLEDKLTRTVIMRLAGTPAVAGVEARRWQRLVQEGSRNIADGQARGAIGAGQDSTLLAAMVLGAVRAAASSQLSQDIDVDPEALAEQIWQFLSAGLGLNNAPPASP